MDITKELEYINSIFPTVGSTYETYATGKVTPHLLTCMREVINELLQREVDFKHEVKGEIMMSYADDDVRKRLLKRLRL